MLSIEVTPIADTYVKIAVPLPLRSIFIYRIPEMLVPQYKLGQIVKIPFGKRVTQGFALELAGTQDIHDVKNIKEIIEFLPGGAVFDHKLFELYQWIAQYYHHPLGQVIKTALPQIKNYRPMPLKNVAEEKKEEPLALQNEQKKAYDIISPSLSKDTFAPYLLHGITGSGKTEVYLHLIQKTLELNKTAIVLVPEISLTPQMESRFLKRFGSLLTTYHSGLAPRKRFWNWKQILENKASIVLGTRSAIFAPFSRLGLIIIDEEHDSSFKQEEGLLYNARNLALVRGKLQNLTVVLGSATPSLESYVAAENKKYHYVRLSNRISDSVLPSVTVVTLKNNPSLISFELKKALEENLKNQEQSLIFLNRRGFSNFLICEACGFCIHCTECSVTLTYHKKINLLKCHYCNASQVPLENCPKCGSCSMKNVGSGTEKIEEHMRQLFPQARIARLDRDITSKKGTLEKILEKLRNQEIDILIGTQMITKGHDYPNITLVGILLADAILNLPDFRATEKTFQLLSQVAGRAGRGTKLGRVIIQTYNPNHYLLQDAQKHDFIGFAKKELDFRKNLSYPPFSRLCNIRITGADKNHAWEQALKLKKILTSSSTHHKSIEIRGPVEAPLSRIKGKYRYHLLIKSPTIQDLHSQLKHLSLNPDFLSTNNVRITLDIDPLNLL